MLTIILKPIERCIANCIYCDVIIKKNKKTMPYDLLRTVYRKINTYLEKLPEEEVTITWHGGEITLLGAEYFEKAYEFQNTECKRTQERISYIVQSNLLMLNQGIVDGLKQLGIKQVGSSFDPLPGIRGIGSKRDSYRYNRMFLAGAKLLEKNDIAWGVINVVHKRQLSRARDVYYCLANLSESISINPVQIYGDDPHDLRITGEEFADFMGEIFPLWLKQRDFNQVRPFNSFYNLFLKKETRLVCSEAGRCAFRWLYIGPSGESAQCGTAGDHSMAMYGNIKNFELDTLMDHPYRHELAERVKLLQTGHCKDCRFWRMCHGGCFIDALMVNGRLNSVSQMACDWTKKFFTSYYEPILGTQLDMRARDTSLGARSGPPSGAACACGAKSDH